VGQGIPFLIGKWVKGNVQEAIPYADQDDLSIIGEDALGASCNLDGLVIDVVLIPFQLARGMDCLALPSVCVLMHDGDCWPMLGLDDSPSHHNGNIGDLVVVNASDIDRSIRFLDDTNVVTSNATIGTSIHE